MKKTKITFSLDERVIELLRGELENQKFFADKKEEKKIDEFLAKIGGTIEFDTEILRNEDDVENSDENAFYCGEYFISDFAEDLSFILVDFFRRQLAK